MFQLHTEHSLPVSALLLVLGRWHDKQSSAGKGSKAPPHNWRWCDVLVVLMSERESLLLPQYNSYSHPLKQEFPRPFIQYHKRCKDFFFFLVQNSLPLGEHPWRFNIRRMLAAELGYLPAPKQSHTCSVETLWERREKDFSRPRDFHEDASAERSECMA